MTVVDLTKYPGHTRARNSNRTTAWVADPGQVGRVMRVPREAAQLQAWRGLGAVTISVEDIEVLAVVTAISVPHQETGRHVLAFVAQATDAIVVAAAAPGARATFHANEDAPWAAVAGRAEIVEDLSATDEPTAVALCVLNAAVDQAVPCEHQTAYDAAKVCIAIEVDKLVGRDADRRIRARLGEAFAH